MSGIARNAFRMRRLVAILGFVFAAAPMVHAYDDSLLPAMNGQASDFAERRAGKDVNASVRFGVTEDGIYRVSYSALTNAGVASANLVGSMMRLFCRTQEVAIWVSSSNQWTGTDYFLFAGGGFDGYYSATNVYWLGFGPSGKRMATRTVAPEGGVAVVTSYREKALHHVESWFKNSYRPMDDSLDHWVDLYVSDTASASVTLATGRAVTNEAPLFEAVMLGYTSEAGVSPDHCTVVTVSNTVIGRFLYDGQTTAVISGSFPASLLGATNSIGFQQVRTNGVASDAAYLERCSITYSRGLYAGASALAFNGATGTNNYLVRGFPSNNAIYAFDVTSPGDAVMLSGGVVTNVGAGEYALLFGDASVTTARYAVCQSVAFKSVASVSRVLFRDLASTNRQADYVVICPYEFRQPVYRLLALRHAQGLSVAVAPLPDVYNEFGYGMADAAAIKQFIGYAFHHWRTPPRYIVLAGTGTYDPRHHKYSAPDVIPVYQGPCYEYIPEYNLWTALDNWYVTVEKESGADYYPNVMLGRIPVETAGQMSGVVDKIIAFEGVPANDDMRTFALLVADKKDDVKWSDFRGASEAVRTNFMGGMTVATVYKEDFWSSGQVADEINYGRFVVNYFGHGMVDYWASSPNLLTTADVNGLTNSAYPIVTMVTCLSGAFQDPAVCLVESFMKSTKGASACFATSGLTSLIAGRNLADGFYDALYRQRVRRLGDAVNAAYLRLFEQSGNTPEALFFNLFGDPAMIVNP